MLIPNNHLIYILENMSQQYVTPLVSNFFFTFARMEYALKATGRFKRNCHNAEADWTKLAKDICNSFNKNAKAELKEAVEYYLSSPPMKQVINNNQLEWDNTLPDYTSELDLILSLINRVRNNLFHGGKFRDRYLAEDERSEQLIRHGLTIMNHCLILASDLNEAFKK